MPPTVGGGGVEERGTLSFPPGKPPAKLPPAPLGYELIRELDKGGMGVVYLAREQATNRHVAMKFLLGVANGPAVDRFLAEVRALAALDHPNIVRVLATDFYRADPYFTMEYLPGGTLADLVEARGTLPPEEAAELIRVVAGAVRVAHAHPDRIIHRDIKPSNVLLAKDGSPKLSDFGLAKRSLQDDGITTHTGPIGTPGYMPPEQVSSQWGEVSVASDVYSLGATLYYLLTGQPPFRGRDKIDTMNKVPRELPVRPRVHCPEIPLALEAIVMKCLEKKPADRYPSADEFIADLENYRDGKPTRALPLTRWRRARLQVQRNRRGIVAVGLAVCLLLGAVYLGVVLQRPDDPLKQMQAALVAGEEVTLVPARGKPRWHQWRVGAPELVASAEEDGGCSFEVIEFGLLELCPDPLSDHYRLRAEIRYRQSKGMAPDAQEGTTAAGIFFGASHLRGANGIQAHAFLTVAFAEVPRVPDPPGKYAQLRRAILLLQPDKNTELGQSGIRNIKFTQSEGLPGPWRVIELEVSPAGIKAYWEEVDENKSKKMVLFADLPTQVVRAEYQKLTQKLVALPPGHNMVIPEWNPRMPLGIWCNRAAIEVRKVTLTPLH